MMTITAWKPLLVAGCLLLTGAAAGCTTQSDAAPTSPKPKPTATATSENPLDREARERGEAATKAYEQGERAAYKMANAGGASKKTATKKLKPYMSGDYLKDYVQILTFMQKEKLRIKGTPTTRSFPTGGDTNRQLLTVCMDVSKTATLDRNNKNVDPPENKVQVLKVDMRRNDGKWKGINADSTYFETFDNTICED